MQVWVKCILKDQRKGATHHDLVHSDRKLQLSQS